MQTEQTAQATKSLAEKAKVFMPKLKDLQPKDNHQKLWEVQAAMLPKSIFESLEVECILHSEEQEERPKKIICGDFIQVIPRDENCWIKLPIYIQMTNRRKWKRIYKTVDGKSKPFNVEAPLYRIEVLNNAKVKKAIDEYIKEVG